MKKIIPFFLTLIVSLTGCKAAGALNGNWETTALFKDGVAQTIAVSNINIEVKGTKASVNGCAGINLFSGFAKVSDKKFIPQPLGVTRMMGDPEVDAFEMLFLDVLNNAKEYSVEGKVLTISAPDKNMKLIFQKKE